MKLSSEIIQKKTCRYYNKCWEDEFSWLIFNDKLMKCQDCIEVDIKRDKGFVIGSNNFQRGTLVRHASSNLKLAKR